ncbi:hypothetical protein WN943_018328 [Citrus x changshan-huyou]
MHPVRLVCRRRDFLDSTPPEAGFCSNIISPHEGFTIPSPLIPQLVQYGCESLHLFLQSILHHPLPGFICNFPKSDCLPSFVILPQSVLPWHIHV